MDAVVKRVDFPESYQKKKRVQQHIGEAWRVNSSLEKQCWLGTVPTPPLPITFEKLVNNIPALKAAILIHHNTPGLIYFFGAGGIAGREAVLSFKTYIAQLKISRSKILWMEVSLYTRYSCTEVRHIYCFIVTGILNLFGQPLNKITLE